MDAPDRIENRPQTPGNVEQNARQANLDRIAEELRENKYPVEKNLDTVFEDVLRKVL